MNHNYSIQKISNYFQKLNYNDLIIFIIPFTIFLIYLFVFDPGILSFDSYNQMHQIATGQFGNAHPFFHTFIEMLCLNVYPSPFSVAFLQITVFSAMWMFICKYFRQDITSNRISKDKQFIFQVIFTLIISLIPLNAVFSITLWKDVFFSYFLMFLCFLLKVLFDKKGHVSYPFVVILCLVMAFVAELRLNGLYVIIIFLIILSVYLYKNNKVERLYTIVPLLTITFILLFSSISIFYDIEDTQTDFVMDKVSHMLAYYEINHEIDPVDEDVLHELMDEQKINDNFVITYKDSLRNNAVNYDVWDKNKDTYIGMAISYSLKNPILCIDYLFNSIPMVWDISNDYYGLVYSTDIDTARDKFYNLYKISPVTDYDNASSKNSGTAIYDNLNSFVEYFKDNEILNKLFINTALCMYLSFIVMIGIWMITKSKSIFLVYLPNLLNIFIVFMSTPSQDTRYLYPNFLVLYFLIIVLVGCLFKYGFRFDRNELFSKSPKNETKQDFERNSIDNNVNYQSESKIMNGTNETSNNIKNINPHESKTNTETPEEMEARIRNEILDEIYLKLSQDNEED